MTSEKRLSELLGGYVASNQLPSRGILQHWLERIVALERKAEDLERIVQVPHGPDDPTVHRIDLAALVNGRSVAHASMSVLRERAILEGSDAVRVAVTEAELEGLIRARRPHLDAFWRDWAESLIHTLEARGLRELPSALGPEVVSSPATASSWRAHRSRSGAGPLLETARKRIEQLEAENATQQSLAETWSGVLQFVGFDGEATADDVRKRMEELLTASDTLDAWEALLRELLGRTEERTEILTAREVSEWILGLRDALLALLEATTTPGGLVRKPTATETEAAEAALRVRYDLGKLCELCEERGLARLRARFERMDQ